MTGGIDFGGLDLMGVEDYDGVTFEAMGDGATLGNPQPVDRSVVSGLLDGSFVVTDSHSNREASFQVWIRATDSAALAFGEKLLFDRCSQPVEFGWTPPDGWGARTVFEALTSHLEHEFDDLKEIKQLTRSYRLRIICYPFGFSEDEVVDVAVEAPPVTPVEEVISNGTSATGWTSPGGTVVASGGSLAIPSSGPVGSYQDVGGTVYSFVDETTKVLSPAVDFTATRYLSADVRYEDINLQFIGTDAYSAFPAYVDGARLQVASVQTVPNVAPGTRRITWRCTDPSATSFRLTAFYQQMSSAGYGFRVDNVVRRNTLPDATSGTGRQSMRSLSVTGSARTAASVAIEHPTAALGDVLFYTSAALGDGYDPAMRRWLVAGPTVVTDAGTISGSRSTGTHTYDVPATLLPSGPFLLMLRARSNQDTLAGDASVTVSAVVGGTEFASETLPTVEGLPQRTNPFATVPAGIVTLPGVKLPPQSESTIRFQVSGLVEIDELLIYFIGDGADLTHVRCGSGTPALGSAHSRLFLDSASLANDGAPGLFVGTQANRSDAFHPGYPAVQAWGRHPIAPPTVLLHVVTTGAANPSVTARHRPAWFTHAGQ